MEQPISVTIYSNKATSSELTKFMSTVEGVKAKEGLALANAEAGGAAPFAHLIGPVAAIAKGISAFLKSKVGGKEFYLEAGANRITAKGYSADEVKALLESADALTMVRLTVPSPEAPEVIPDKVIEGFAKKPSD